MSLAGNGVSQVAVKATAVHQGVKARWGRIALRSQLPSRVVARTALMMEVVKGREWEQ